MAVMYYDQDANLNSLQGQTVAVVGYGSQGHAHALNLRDSGIDVIVANRPGSANYEAAVHDGFAPVSADEAAAKADVIVILAPDQAQPDIYYSDIEPHLTDGKALVFAHGFNIHFKQIVPPENVDVFMVAPKSPGHLVRRMYEAGQGVPGLLAVYQDATRKAKQRGLAYAKAIGCTRASSRRRFKRRPRPTFSASRRCCAAASASSFGRDSTRWWMQVINRKWRTLNAFTS